MKIGLANSIAAWYQARHTTSLMWCTCHESNQLSWQSCTAACCLAYVTATGQSAQSKPRTSNKEVNSCICHNISSQNTHVQHPQAACCLGLKATLPQIGHSNISARELNWCICQQCILPRAGNTSSQQSTQQQQQQTLSLVLC